MAHTPEETARVALHKSFVMMLEEIDTLRAEKVEMLAGLRRAEQTIRNLGMTYLFDNDDARTIALNEAENLRRDIAKAEGVA